MRIALFADLHGNRPATMALEQDLLRQKPDRVFCLGDIVGKGPSNDFTFDWAMAHADVILGGNWDYGVGHQQYSGDAYYWEQLGPERLRILRELPLEKELLLSGRRVRFFHGRPVMESLVTVRSDVSLIEPFFRTPDGGRYDAVIYADAHRQALRTLTPGLFANVGSVGNALGEPRCCYALLECQPGAEAAEWELRFRQLEYDREAAIRQAEAAPRVPRIDTYINELRTGIYSRNQ